MYFSRELFLKNAIGEFSIPLKGYFAHLNLALFNDGEIEVKEIGIFLYNVGGFNFSIGIAPLKVEPLEALFITIYLVNRDELFGRNSDTV